jgi:hypothetical protein
MVGGAFLGSEKGGDYTPTRRASWVRIWLDFNHLRNGVNRPRASSVISPGLRQEPVFIQTTREEKPMKQLFAALVAAAFAAASFAAVAQDKKDKGMEKKSSAMEKKDAKKGEPKKGEGKKKSEGKKSEGKKSTDKMDKKS